MVFFNSEEQIFTLFFNFIYLTEREREHKQGEHTWPVIISNQNTKADFGWIGF